MDDLLSRSALELAGLVHRGELGARELVQTSLDRIESVDGQVNAFVELDADRALAAADLVRAGDERPFAGVPVAVKNNVPVAGMRFAMGAELFGEFRAQHDAFVVRRLREAGFIVVGTTNLPEFGILPTTEPRRFGPTRNPWDLGRTPGGSSGGAAAAVAAGMVPLAHGNDGGGSIRIPAACCGLVGLKPSRGRVSRGPDTGDSFLATDGVLTRTVDETAVLLDVLAGYEVGDSTWAPKPPEPYALAAQRDPGRLRIAVSADSALHAPLDPECDRVMRETADLLASLGHEVTEATPTVSLPDEQLLPLFAGVFGPNVCLGMGFAAMMSGQEVTEELVEPLSWLMWEQATKLPSVAFLGVLTQLQALSREIVGFFAHHDLLLTPALAERPLPIGELNGCGENPGADFARSGAFTPYTALFNATGQPAISVPLGHGEDGLPTGIQLVAPPLGEDTLLQVARQLELARPWGERRPPALG